MAAARATDDDGGGGDYGDSVDHTGKSAEEAEFKFRRPFLEQPELPQNQSSGRVARASSQISLVERLF